MKKSAKRLKTAKKAKDLYINPIKKESYILKRVGQELPDFKPAGDLSLERLMNQEATRLVGW